MWYSEDDFYEVRVAQVEADKKLASKKLEAELFSSVREKTKWERVQEILDELDSDPELMSDFQLQLRRRKLKQIKIQDGTKDR